MRKWNSCWLRSKMKSELAIICLFTVSILPYDKVLTLFSYPAYLDRKEKQALIAELEVLNTFNATLKDELHSMNRVCSGLFDTIQNIKTDIQAAEALSLAIRSISATCSANTSERDSVSVVSNQTNSASSISSSDFCSTPTSANVSRTPIDQLIKEIEARYAE